MVSERQQRICFRIIGADRAYRDAVRFYPEAAHDSPLSVLGERFDLDLVAFRDTRVRMSASFMNTTMRPPNTPRYRLSRL
jgi:hypothetical protein